jgi:hypothetical protein
MSKEKRLFIIDGRYKIWAYSYDEALKMVRQMKQEGNAGWLIANY